MTDTTKNNVPDGFILLQTQNGAPKYAACMTGRLAGWLMKKYPDGNWVSERKLTNLEVMQAEDQRDDGIVHETPAATIQEPVMVAEPVGKQAQFDRDIKLAESVRRHIANHCHNKLGVDAARTVNMVELAPIVDRAAPMVADPAGVALEAAAEAIYNRLPMCQGHDAKSMPWKRGGNSMKQDEARRYASAALQAAATVKAVPSEALEVVGQQCGFPGTSWGRLCDPEEIEPMKARGYYFRTVFAAPLADKTGGGE